MLLFTVAAIISLKFSVGLVIYNLFMHGHILGNNLVRNSHWMLYCCNYCQGAGLQVFDLLFKFLHSIVKILMPLDFLHISGYD